MALPCGTPDHYDLLAPARDVAVKPAYAITLDGWFPLSLSRLRASVTIWEATAPVKLPTMQCPPAG